MAKTAKYLDIADDLRKKLSADAFHNGRLPPERAIAEEYAVNRLTVRKSLKLLFDEGLIAKMGVHGTFAAESAPTLSNKTVKKIITLLFNGDPNKTYYGGIINSLRVQSRNKGAAVDQRVINALADIDELIEANKRVKVCDGIILFGLMTAELVIKLKQLDIPIVLIGALTRPDIIEKEFDQVKVNAFQYVYDGVSTLLSKGYTRIAFVDGPLYQWGMTAQRAYRQAYEDHKIKPPKTTLFNFEEESPASGVKHVGKILKSRPDALFIHSESAARGVIDGLFLRGVKIPDDIVIVTLGHPHDSVSHLNFPRFEINPDVLAKKAVHLLLERVANPQTEIKHDPITLSLLRSQAIPNKQ